MSTSHHPSRRNKHFLALIGTLVLALAGCGLAGGTASDERTISIIATDSPPYHDPLEIAREQLEAEGWRLDVRYVTDIVQPNHAVSAGEADFNFFQHGAYLQTFNRDNGTDVVPLFYAVGSPAGVYSTRYDDISQLPDGARIALPVDPANNGRALHLLAGAGRLKLREGAQVVTTSQRDIVDNPHGYSFVEVDQQTLTQTLPDVDAGFLFSRQAIEIGLDVEGAALLREQDLDAVPYRIVVGGRPDEVGSAKARALQAALQSPRVRDFFKQFYGEWAPLPWTEDPQAQLGQWWKDGGR
ncbi:D-methionine transport system substrate-binding protein [Saccharopolyspora antimicrobica]|uniref:D-methionine transport system substrate-binding protein n=1 Tax=Saccharopolyspora antimicrobica TaxID=455193 RepID=A0A1I4QXZ9_9PSEU|nr:MetQ/NlpA family ABC transporter substrate-binding protein [Saccharopolyspora antimicrobica]RKT88249.1 D-methionine transport system substrate-binding protein [Saccharopolyspora antimicrobica]SFM44909.1 D-methionine transport system substrate-binding protein [Saccharopolyspora antimicrobica]